MKIDLLHNKIIAECSTESFRAQLGAAINSHFCEKYGSEILGVQMYEDHLSSRFYDGKTFYYPLSVKTEQGVFAEWVCWTVKRGAFENDNPFKHTGKSQIDFIFPDFVPSEFTDRHTARYFDGAGAKLRIETPAPDYSVLSGRYSQCFVDMLSEKLPKIVEEAASVKGIAESGIEFAVVFAPETYMEHTSENVTYRRILLCDSGSAPRDLWIKWTRLDGEGAYSIADTPDEENIVFEIGEDVPQKIKEKEYRFLSGAGKDKYHSAMGRKHITEWREVIKRAVKKGELSKVEVADCSGASFVKIKPEKAPVAEVFGKSEIEEKPELNAAEEASANEARADENDELDAILMQAKAIADGAFLGKEKEEEERFAYAANESAAFARSATSAAVITEDSFKPEEDEELAKAMEMARLALDSMDTADNAENEDAIFIEDEISAEGEDENDDGIFAEDEISAEDEDGILIEDEVTAEDELSIAEAEADEEPMIAEAEGDAEDGGAEVELEDDADEDRELEEMTRMALEALALARRQSEQDTFADQITDASEDEPSGEEDELADEEESLEIEELADEAEASDGEEELPETEEADFADEETDGEAELIGEDEAAPSVIVPMDPTEEEYMEGEDDELYAEALADARALEPDGELSDDEKTPDAPESAFADSTSAPDIAKIREEIEAKVRLEYESQARKRAEEEAERLRREGEMLRKENERLLELARQSEVAKQLAEENHKNEKEQLKAQIEAGLRREAKERERLAEAARLATMEQQRAELEMIRAEQQRAEDEKARREAEARAEEERLAEEKRIREQKARREAEAKAAQIKNYTFTTKVVSLIFRKSVDPNLISRIEATIKATLEYLGKQSVPMKIKATIPNSNMVRLEFREFPEQEMELLGSIVKIMGNNNLGIAKAIIE